MQKVNQTSGFDVLKPLLAETAAKTLDAASPADVHGFWVLFPSSNFPLSHSVSSHFLLPFIYQQPAAVWTIQTAVFYFYFEIFSICSIKIFLFSYFSTVLILFPDFSTILLRTRQFSSIYHRFTASVPIITYLFLKRNTPNYGSRPTLLDQFFHYFDCG